jgi:hypothetical protein
MASVDFLHTSNGLHIAASFLRQRRLPHQSRQLLGIIPDELLQIAHKFIHESLSLHLRDHVAVVVVAQRPRQLLVVHGGFVFSFAPQLRHVFGIVELELAGDADPLDDGHVVLVGENFEEKLPQLDLAVVAVSVVGADVHDW